MTMRILIFIALGAIWASWSPASRAEDAVYRDSRRPTNQRVKDLLDRMTLDEKIEQLSQKSTGGIAMRGDEADLESLKKLFGDRSPGVLCVNFGDDLQQQARRLAAAQRYLRERTRLGIPALTVNEGLHGVLAKGATIYPQFLALGCTFNPALAEEMGTQIGKEASAGGLNHLLTPMIEVVRDPRWGRVEECIGERPFLVGRMCSAYTLGVQGDLRGKPLAEDKALAMLKTFAGYSMPVNGINIANCVLGERELRSVYFPPVERVIRYVFDSPAPLWAFGYGLTYTTFEYKDIKVETPIVPAQGELAVSFTLSNTGACAGKEVAQVYVRQEVGSVTTPVMRLAGFEKIELKSGESRRVAIRVPAPELAVWNRQMKRVVEPGRFTVMVAASAEDVRLRSQFDVIRK